MTYENIKVNSVPAITWNWLKSNNDLISINSVKADFTETRATVKDLPQGVTISSEKAPQNIPEIPTGVFNRSNPKQKDNRNPDGTINEKREYALQSSENHPIANLINEILPDGQYITISGKLEKPLILNFDFDKAAVSKHLIHAKADCEATVIFIYHGNADTILLQSKIYAEENAKLHIIKVQLLGDSSLQLDDTGITAQANSDIKFTLVELGGHHVDSGLNVNLLGYQSAFHANTAYICTQNQYLDMNHIVYHTGKKTVCDMQVHGTIKDQATKVYRGTLDFQKGCSGSQGNEFEETLILSPEARNKSFPIILCGEDDIQGEHGSTIGRISSDLLFYMQTRGISRKAAEEMMARAKVQAVMDLIPDEETKNLITEYLDKKE